MTVRTRQSRFVGVGAMGLALVVCGTACSKSSGPSSSVSNGQPPAFVTTEYGGAESTAAAAAPQRTPARPAFDLCRMIPFDTVARILHETIGRSVSTSTTRPGGMCTYRDVAHGTPGVRVLIDIGRDRSAASAGVTLLGQRGQLGAHGIATADIAGIGDAAFGSSDSAGRYTVMMQDGAITGQISVNVRGADAQSLRPAAAELAKRTLAVLH